MGGRRAERRGKEGRRDKMNGGRRKLVERKRQGVGEKRGTRAQGGKRVNEKTRGKISGYEGRKTKWETEGERTRERVK